MLKTIARPLAGAAALALVATLASPAWAGEGEKKVRVKKIHRCEGENCEELHEAAGGHHAIFINKDGETHDLEGAHGMTWVDADGGDVRIIRGGSGTFLGVQLTDLTDELRAHFGVPEGQGVMVSKVVDDSPAARAGVEAGDILTAVDGEMVKGAGSLSHLIGARDEGETVALELYRDGRVETLSPTLAKHEMKAGGMHRMHKMGSPGMHQMGGHGMRQIQVHCEGEDGEEDCEVNIGDGGIKLGDFDCGGAEECRVNVECTESGCECTANGEAVDCEALPGFAERHGGE